MSTGNRDPSQAAIEAARREIRNFNVARHQFEGSEKPVKTGFYVDSAIKSVTGDLEKKLADIDEKFHSYVKLMEGRAADLVKERNEANETIKSITTDPNYLCGTYYWIRKHDKIMEVAATAMVRLIELECALRTVVVKDFGKPTAQFDCDFELITKTLNSSTPPTGFVLVERKELEKYANHRPCCSHVIRSNMQCDCGLTQLLETKPTEKKEQDDPFNSGSYC